MTYYYDLGTALAAYKKAGFILNANKCTKI